MGEYQLMGFCESSIWVNSLLLYCADTCLIFFNNVKRVEAQVHGMLADHYSGPFSNKLDFSLAF